jgi:predicted acetyltransferase
MEIPSSPDGGEWIVVSRGGVSVEEIEKRRTYEATVCRDLMRFKKLFTRHPSRIRFKITRSLAMERARIMMQSSAASFRPRFDYPSLYRRRLRSYKETKVDLRIAQQQDFDVVISYLCHTVIGSSRTFFWNIPSISDAFCNESLLVITNCDIVVGFLVYSDLLCKTGDVDIASFEVFIYDRNHQVGRKAVKLFEIMMKEAGKVRITLEPIETAEKFWKHAGFKETDSDETWAKSIV